MQVEFRCREAGLGDRNIGVGGREQGRRIFQLLRGDDVRLLQLFLAIGLLLGLQAHGLGAPKRCFGLFDLHAEGRRIDAVEHVAFIDLGTLLEDALDDDAGNARADLGDACRGNAAGELVGDRQRFGLGREDRDRGRWECGGGRLLVLFLATGKKNHSCQGGGQCRSVHAHSDVHIR
ncbi:hypothetical protein D9M72_390280 [compost metagenome]